MGRAELALDEFLGSLVREGQLVVDARCEVYEQIEQLFMMSVDEHRCVGCGADGCRRSCVVKPHNSKE